MLVSFDTINMFPSINNKTGVERVRSKLEEVAGQFDLPVEYSYNWSIGNWKFFSLLRTVLITKERNSNGTKNTGSYAKIVAEHEDKNVLEAKAIHPELRLWFTVARFRY